MEQKMQLYGFNNLTKALSLSLYDVYYAESEAERSGVPLDTAGTTNTLKVQVVGGKKMKECRNLLIILVNTISRII